ncbi:uncharacterized protein MYCFIDRAFT_171446 [Pseudocercospora fijiensis CIRAD86]|uniref:Uncharacterized protein n=1 Tax=Pseudocercospora fijiensis (strain CIRAD86) TaxID=383855 RepID=M3ALR0_PSEFD|nr:uncharacterized protein MYCFIDRAFT_171446 [Pseudocercospora fijiensis CIRAD86]EME85531.1 hypothetical protein MYCFIDRAFT_171446 [Pseudocercospora fijiensis CIRAD86]
MLSSQLKSTFLPNFSIYMAGLVQPRGSTRLGFFLFAAFDLATIRRSIDRVHRCVDRRHMICIVQKLWLRGSPTLPKSLGE